MGAVACLLSALTGRASRRGLSPRIGASPHRVPALFVEKASTLWTGLRRNSAATPSNAFHECALLLVGQQANTNALAALHDHDYHWPLYGSQLGTHRISQRKKRCFASSRSFGLCYKIQARRAQRARHGGHPRSGCKGVRGLRRQVGRAPWRRRPRASAGRIPAHRRPLETGEQSEGRHQQALARQGVPRSDVQAMGRPPVEPELLRRQLPRRPHRNRSAVHRGAAQLRLRGRYLPPLE